MKNPVRVLIGENNPLESQLTAENLGRHFPDIEATTVHSRDTFLDAIEFDEFDLVLADSRLPGFRSLEIIDALQQRNVQAPLVLLTSPGEEREAASAIKRGVSDIVVKTPEYGELLAVVAERVMRYKSQAKVMRLLEQELHTSEDRVITLLSESKEAITILQNGKCVHVNQAFSGLVKSPNREELVGLSVSQLIGSDQPEVEAFLEGLESKSTGSKSRRATLRLKDGLSCEVMLTANRFYFKGHSALKVSWRPLMETKNEPLSTEALERLQSIIEDAQELIQHNDITVVGPKLLMSFSKNLNVQGGSIYVMENDRLRLLKTIEEPHQPQYIEFPLVDGSVLDQVFKQDQPVFIQNLPQKKEGNHSGWSGYQDNSLMVIKLKDELGKVKGLVSLHNKVEPPFTKADQQLSMLLANYGLAALKNGEISSSLKESESKSQALSEESPTGVVVLCDGKFAYVNPQMAEMLEYGRKKTDELIGMPFEYFLPTGERQNILTQLDFMLEFEDTSFRSEMQLLTKEGNTVWAEALATQITHQDRPAIICNFIDITVRKHAEEVKGFQSQILRQISDWVTVTDLSGKIVYVSPSVSNIMGLSPKDVQGKTPEEAYGKYTQHHSTSDMQLASLLSGNGQATVEFATKKKPRIVVNMKSNTMVDNAGKPMGVITVARDITREEDLESQFLQSQKTEVLGALAGGLAHDFNNLVTAITGHVQIAMMQMDKEDPLYQNMEQIKAATNQTKALTKRLLTFSRRQNINPQVINVNDILDATHKILDRLIDKRIELVLEPGEVNPIKMDPVQLEQIVLNLAVNARDAMPNGGRLYIGTQSVEFDETYCATHPYVTAGEYVRLRVSDTGCGMDSEIKRQIFEPFFTTKNEDEGTGLGLATVYGIVKQHHGSIEVHSEVNAGTTFDIAFPCISELLTPIAKEKEEQAVTGGNETILMLEDERIVSNVTREILTNLGYNVLSSHSAKEALKLTQINAGKIDLLITNVINAELNGPDLARQVKQYCPTLKVLYTSGYSAATIRNNGVLQQTDHLIEKPYEPPELALKIRCILDQDLVTRGEMDGVHPHFRSN